jgi:hypothetical protein
MPSPFVKRKIGKKRRLFNRARDDCRRAADGI